ncbi:MAG: hypothetical protein IKY23_12390 [Lachnospiraceae bacterium]|nr:hypothetical protein [Lachnospiraceae bacterium]
MGIKDYLEDKIADAEIGMYSMQGKLAAGKALIKHKKDAKANKGSWLPENIEKTINKRVTDLFQELQKVEVFSEVGIKEKQKLSEELERFCNTNVGEISIDANAIADSEKILRPYEKLGKLLDWVNKEHDKLKPSKIYNDKEVKEDVSQEELFKIVQAEMEEFRLSQEIWKVYTLVRDGLIKIRMDIGSETSKYIKEL